MSAGACHVEAWRDDLTREWGWQCFSCSEAPEQGGYTSLAEAEQAGEHHRVEVATQQLIDDGELP